MSSMMTPVGPEDPSVYWRRRGVVGFALLVLLWLVYAMFSSLFGSDDANAQVPAPAPVTTPAAGASVAPSPSASTTASASASAKSSEQAVAEKSATASKKTGPARCADSDLEVRATPAASSTPVGKGMDVTLSVKNTGDATCERNLSSATNEVRIVSGRVLVWSSNYCGTSTDGTSAKASPTTLKPGQTWKTTVTWPGKITAAKCPAAQPTAANGNYRTQGHVGDLWSGETAFRVS